MWISTATCSMQTRRFSKPSARAATLIRLGSREVNARAYLGRLNITGSDQQKKVGLLSGGERNRVHLARMLKEGANVLLLDEPTNDLDVNTMRALEEGLLNFAGCVLVISHDRWFLDRIATHIMAFEGDSRGDLLRRQLHRVRGRPPQTAGQGGGHPAPHQVPQADQGIGALSFGIKRPAGTSLAGRSRFHREASPRFFPSDRKKQLQVKLAAEGESFERS
jgi:energy-coupling factor transporter ATP-binding protein EcfA2